MEEINISLSLTGSSFFDTVVLMRARELEKKYPGVSVKQEKKKLIISGTLEAEKAAALRKELN